MRFLLWAMVPVLVLACGETAEPPAAPIQETARSTKAGLDATRYLDVRVFGGWVSFSSDKTEKKFVYQNSYVTLTCDHRVSGSLYLLQKPAEPHIWDGRLKGNAQLRCVRTQVFTSPQGSYTTRKTISGPSQLIDTNARAFLDPRVHDLSQARHFGFLYGDDGSNRDSASIDVTETNESPSETRKEERKQYMMAWWKQSLEFWPLPESGLELSGSAAGDPQDTACGPLDETVPWRFSFYLFPMELNEVKLILEPLPGYESWLPSAPSPEPGLDTEGVPPLGGTSVSLQSGAAAPGGEPPLLDNEQKVRFRARLLGPSGIKARNMTFRLKASRVPGEANNAPLTGDPSSEDDLAMESVPETPVDVTYSDLSGTYGALFTGKTPDGSYESADIEVISYDWGAFGELEASATLESGTTLNAQVVFEGTNASVLRIPKRAATSYVADAWKDDNGAAGKADDDDSDNMPVGDRNPGDGLTLYEEYRGFQVQAKHVRTHPGKKDYFLSVAPELRGESSFADPVKKGIALFEEATKLEIHQLDPKEFIPSDSKSDFDLEKRVINHFHAPDGRRRGHQHMVMLTLARTQLGSSKAWGRDLALKILGSPEAFSRVEVEETSLKAEAGGSTQVATDVAHELGHTVNIYHHGEREVRERFFITQGDGVIRESTHPTLDEGQSVRVDELYFLSGERFYHYDKQRRIGGERVEKYLISYLPPNQYSGDETCFMRYNSANSIVIPDRFLNKQTLIDPREPPGTTLCADETAKSFNRDRNGNAAPTRGFCMHQILVNDAVTAPSRRLPE